MGPVQGLDSAAYLMPGIRKWLLILSIFDRLYTSVIPRKPENNGPEVSWPTDLSPTTTFSLAALPVVGAWTSVAAAAGGGCTRGIGRLGGREGYYTGYPPSTVPGSHIHLNLASGPYLRPNEGYS